METFELCRVFQEREIRVLVLACPGGVHVSLFGGDRPHIGAVGIADPAGTCSVTQFPGHREGCICSSWTAGLADAGFLPAVVEAGIHYDGLDAPGIQTVLTIAGELLQETLARLREERDSTAG